MTAPSDYERFVNGLNAKHMSEIVRMNDLVMYLSFDIHAMGPNEAKKVISDLMQDGLIRKVDDTHIDLTKLYDRDQRRYVMRTKTGKLAKTKDQRIVPKRSVRYVSPGHTEVTYEHRVLDIRFKESQEEYDRRTHQRRSDSARNRKQPDDTIYVDRDGSGMMTYTTKTGRNAELRSKSRKDKGTKAITKANIQRDRYTLEEMRALLMDDHWEEVCNNTNWLHNREATVKEFTRYQRLHGMA